MPKSFYVNRYNSSILSLSFISHVLGVTLLIFFSIFLLGPAIFLILNGAYFTVLFFRPFFTPLYAIYKFIFRASDRDFYIQEVPANAWFWASRAFQAAVSLGQIGLGIYFLVTQGFAQQNLILTILNESPTH